MSSRIAVVLSRKDGFSEESCSAVTLTAEHYTRHSVFRHHTEILGMPELNPRDPDCYRGVVPEDRWWRRRSHAYLRACISHLEETRPRHIDVHNRAETFLCMARQFPSAAVSLWLHNDPQGMGGARTIAQRQQLADRAYRVICVSEWVRARFIEGLERNRERVVVMPNTIDTAGIPARPKQPLVVFVGRIIPEKGAVPFARAAASALPDLPGWQAGIVGADHPATPWYTQQLAEVVAPTQGQVEIMGFLPHAQVMQVFSRAAIAVVPSQWDEPFARTALEAMAAGCAVIASRRGGLPEVVGDAGLLLDEPDPAALAQAITRLAADPCLRQQLQAKAHARATRLFDVRHWAARLDTLRQDIDPGLQPAFGKAVSAAEAAGPDRPFPVAARMY